MGPEVHLQFLPQLRHRVDIFASAVLFLALVSSGLGLSVSAWSCLRFGGGGPFPGVTAVHTSPLPSTAQRVVWPPPSQPPPLLTERHRAHLASASIVLLVGASHLVLRHSRRIRAGSIDGLRPRFLALPALASSAQAGRAATDTPAPGPGSDDGAGKGVSQRGSGDAGGVLAGEGAEGASCWPAGGYMSYLRLGRALFDGSVTSDQLLAGDPALKLPICKCREGRVVIKRVIAPTRNQGRLFVGCPHRPRCRFITFLDVLIVRGRTAVPTETSQGYPVPHCRCGKGICQLLRVKKKGINFGQECAICPDYLNRNNTGCGFFQWLNNPRQQRHRCRLCGETGHWNSACPARGERVGTDDPSAGIAARRGI